MQNAAVQILDNFGTILDYPALVPDELSLKLERTEALELLAVVQATLNAISSVPASTTSIVASDDGATHEPPMKNDSGWSRGTVVERAMHIHPTVAEQLPTLLQELKPGP